ncbi:hypothetical protein QTI17_17275 [Variovorax sp. J31P179]|uniref:hypothetical protein n=1 Tax=Variovorax sp. J31P179 TaxID=3053508 RepID=UPI002576FF01|nr:hypothetical protein [Variovorax sp. J31P179]MDM0082347.1 hypothetical protein [Variovorax sp. J31P179]
MPSVVGIASDDAAVGYNGVARSDIAAEPVPPPGLGAWVPQNRGDIPGSAVLWWPVVGGQALESVEWQTLLTAAQTSGETVFVAGQALPTMSEPLSPEQATWLNEHMGATP